MPATVFATPTVNGYRRFKPNSLAPDRATWGYDNRGAMIRVLGAPGDPATRLENRVGEPAANPYLYVASQIVAGLAGIAAARDPGPPDDAPYAAERTRLPTSLAAALDRSGAGAAVPPRVRRRVHRLLREAQAQRARPLSSAHWTAQRPGDEPTEWEHNEYFDFF